MKAIHYLPPVAALVIAVVWIGGQRRSMAVLEEQCSNLRKAIDARRSNVEAEDAASHRAYASGANSKDKKPIDWKKIAAQMEESRNSGGMGDMRSLLSLQRRLMSMEKDELIAALEEIAALDLPELSRLMLQGMLLGPLLEKDPELALAKFIDRIHDENGSMSWQLSRALTEWAKKDPGAAIAWFDQQIAAGTFESKSLDGKSRSRMQFEGALIATLISSNTEAATLRISALPEEQRREILMNHAANSLKKEDQKAYAALIRQTLPEKDQLESIASFVSRSVYSDEDYTAVTERMDKIEATPAERNACIDKAAESRFLHLANERKITRDDIEQLRNWTASQSPDLTDRATGKALAGALQGNDKVEFSEAAALALEYHNASGSDELLVPLLENWHARRYDNKEQARVLAVKISDETVRNRILRGLEPKAAP